MCNSCFGGNSCWCVILLIIILMFCGGCGNNDCGCSGNNCGCGC